MNYSYKTDDGKNLTIEIRVNDYKVSYDGGFFYGTMAKFTEYEQKNLKILKPHHTHHIDKLVMRNHEALELIEMQAALKKQTDDAVAAAEKQSYDNALANCPTGKTPCRQKWANGDLMSAKYITVDGTEIIDSDSIEMQAGSWYYIDTDLIEAKKTKNKKKHAAKKTEKEEVEIKKHAAIEKARSTGKKQPIDSYMVECRDPREECSQDACTVWIDCDGDTTKTYQHTW